MLKAAENWRGRDATIATNRVDSALAYSVLRSPMGNSWTILSGEKSFTRGIPGSVAGSLRMSVVSSLREARFLICDCDRTWSAAVRHVLESSDGPAINFEETGPLGRSSDTAGESS